MPRPDSTPSRKQQPADAARTPRVPDPADQVAARQAAEETPAPAVEVSKVELAEQAKTLDVPGRSSMDKPALAKAVDRTRGRLGKSRKARVLVADVRTIIVDPDVKSGFRTVQPGEEYESPTAEAFERSLRLGHAHTPNDDG